VKSKIARLFLHPSPMRLIAKELIRKLNLGSYERRMQIGAVDRPQYCHCIYSAAILATKLGYDRISVLEFGVGGGKGLLNIESHAQQMQKLLPINIDIYGFDTGQGLPEPLDYRDLPYHWKKGSYKMDVPKLEARLSKAKLILGDIRDTAGSFFEKYSPAPIGAAMFDLDFYSSTVAALSMFDDDEKYYLPRVFCYFDDIVGTEIQLYNDYTGERLAIDEFNRAHKNKKFAIDYHLLPRQVVDPWCHAIRIYHNFEHSRYNDFVSVENQELPLE